MHSVTGNLIKNMSIKKVNIKQVIPYLKKPWTPIVLGKVGDYDIKLSEFKDEYFWHKHDKHDECMLVYEGSIAIELEGKKEIKLQVGELIVIEKGTPHRSKANERALVLLFERDTIMSDFVKL
jgi:mannose-6-phosphate isomerase-like protein (cupin superfamily)